MFRKLYTYNYIWLIIYLWVISTLPFHQHNHQSYKEAAELGEHTHASKDNSHPTNDDECVICLNIHIPFAIDQLPTIDYAAVELAIYPTYGDDMLILWYNSFILSPTNRGPPISIIS